MFARRPMLIVTFVVGACTPFGAAGTDPDPDGGRAMDAADGSTNDAGYDAGNDASMVATVCPKGSSQVGEYATWGGKVNVHRSTEPAGLWAVDTDCTSGADHDDVNYCIKFWSNVTEQRQLPAVTPEDKPFTSAGAFAPACGGIALFPGVTQFACCAP